MDLREQKFGVEVEMTGITRKRAAQVIGEYLNGTVDFEGGGYGAYDEINNQMDEDDSLDSIRVKAIFYSLYFGENQPSNIDKAKFVDYFIRYEELKRTVTDEEGNEYEETYIVPVPITNLSEVYKNIEATMENSVTYEDMANANEIYYRIKYGTPAPSEGDSFTEWEDWIQGLTPEELEDLYHDLPEGEKGSKIVKLTMSRLRDPYSQERRGQGRYTDCSYLTMWKLSSDRY